MENIIFFTIETLLVLLLITIIWYHWYSTRRYNKAFASWKSKLRVGQTVLFRLPPINEFDKPLVEEYTITDIGNHSIRIRHNKYLQKMVYEMEDIFTSQYWSVEDFGDGDHVHDHDDHGM